MSLAFQHHSYLFNFGVRKDFILGMLKSPKFYNKKAYWFHSANFQPLTGWNMSGRKTVHNLRLQLSRSSQCRCISSLILIINSVVAAKIIFWGEIRLKDTLVLYFQLRRMQEMIARMQAQMQMQMQGGEGESSAVQGHNV